MLEMKRIMLFNVLFTIVQILILTLTLDRASFHEIGMPRFLWLLLAVAAIIMIGSSMTFAKSQYPRVIALVLIVVIFTQLVCRIDPQAFCVHIELIAGKNLLVLCLMLFISLTACHQMRRIQESTNHWVR